MAQTGILHFFSSQNSRYLVVFHLLKMDQQELMVLKHGASRADVCCDFVFE